MGFNTVFKGRFLLDKPLTDEHFETLRELASEEHPGRVVAGGDGKPPSHYCQWIPSNDRRGIEWDGEEKFYYPVAWLEYIINNYLAKWGYVLNGAVPWLMDTHDNTGTLRVDANSVFDDPDPGSKSLD